MIYLEKPDGFVAQFRAVGCFMEVGAEFLLLLRQPWESVEPGKLGIPGGKVDPGENALEAAIREIFEETGFGFGKADIKTVSMVYVIYPNSKFVYHMFRANAGSNMPHVILSPQEHTGFLWAFPERALLFENLMRDLDSCIKLAYGL